MQQNIIVYVAGCYGTFIEWLLNYLQSNIDSLPFENTGSSHKFRGNFLHPKEVLFEYINGTNKQQISRCHPGFFEKVNEHSRPFQDEYSNILQEDISLLKQNFDKILNLTYDHKSILWQENNGLEKIFLSDIDYHLVYQKHGYSKEYSKDNTVKDPEMRCKHIIDKELQSPNSPFTQHNVNAWGKTNIYDFDTWELRELLSLYWFTRSEGQITAWNTIKTNNPDTLCISISDLKSDFSETILKIINFFNIKISQDRIAQLDNIHTEWLSRQTQINKDSICQEIVESLLTNTDLDWSDQQLSIIDQAWIQKHLRDNGVGIKCFNLNDFPTNTSDFQPLLEKL
jgi:hypothetical protein